MHRFGWITALVLFLVSCNIAPTPPLPATVAKVVSASVTPTNTAMPTFTLEPTKTATPTPTNTVLPTPTLEPTKPSTPTATNTALPSSTVAPTAKPPTQTPAIVASTNPAASPGKLDMNSIFPSGKGRDLVLDNCMSCHGFVRVVIGQRTRDQWQYVKRIMRSRVVGLSDEEVDVLFAYLEANFNDTKPVPELPAWFLESVPW